MKYLNDSELQRGLDKWTKILHLQDWEINVTLVLQTTFEDRFQCGDCSVRRSRYGADIRLATFETLDLIGAPGQTDMERTLVHELLHCIFRCEKIMGTEASSEQMNFYEHSIEQIARTLVELDRS